MKVRRQKIIRLRDEGKNERQIEKKTGATKKQIKRAVRRADQDR